MTFEIIRTDRSNGEQVQVGHDIPTREKAEEIQDMLNGTRVRLMRDGSPLYHYQVAVSKGARS